MTAKIITMDEYIARVRLARNIVDSYTIRVEHLPTVIQYIIERPESLEQEIIEAIPKLVPEYPSSREVRAIVRAVRYIPPA